MSTASPPPRDSRDLLDWFVNAADRADARRSARAKAVARSLLTISGVVALLLGAFVFARSEPTVLELALFGVGIATPILAAFAIRAFGRLVWVLTVTNLIGIGCVAVWAWATGGVLSAAMPWLIALLVSLGTFGNSTVIVFAFVADVLVLAALYVATLNNLLPPSAIPEAEQVQLVFLGQISSLVIVTLGTVLVMRARARAKEAIRASERRLQRVVDGLPAVVAYAEVRGGEPRYSFANQLFAQRFGKLPGEIVGKTLREVVGESAYVRLSSFAGRVLAGEAVEYDREFVLPDGTAKYDRVYMKPDTGSSGAVQGIYVFGIDETERKRALIDLQASRERLAEAQMIAHVGNWEFDLATDRLQWSDEVYRIYGHAPGSFMPRFREDYLPATHPDDRQRVLEALAHVVRTRAPHAIEHRVLRPDGVERVVEVRAHVPRTDAEGNVVHLFGVVQDITERSGAAAELLAARNAAEAGSRAKSAFLANMSHEIRTPMNGVIGIAELLLQEPLGARGRRYGETIQRSGRALLGVLDDVLDLSKIEAGRLRLQAAPVDVHALLREMKDLFGEAARAKRVRLLLEPAPEIAPWVTGDALRLRQVLMNLVSNAVKFTAQGTVTVGVRREPGAMTRFEVRDTGIGIAADQQARIFDAFAQAEDGTNRRYGGTGLGLSISRELVRLMGGGIGMHSEPGAGSSFWFSVPLREALAPTARPLVPGNGELDRLPLAGRRVLVVEDEPVNAEVTRVMLLQRGVEVVMAGDGAQAVAEFGRQAFDLILMDCQMPVMDGLEATRRIRAAEASGHAGRTPIVALTAHVLPEHRKECLDAGMDDYLSKPFSAAELERVVARSTAPVTRT